MTDGKTVDIWGCCISRDSFGFFDDEGYTVKVFTGGVSFISEFLPGPAPEDYFLNEELNDREKHNFKRKVACRDYNKTVREEFLGSGAEWLVVDFRAAAYGMYRFVLEDGTERFVSKIEVGRTSYVLNQRGIKHTYNFVDARKFDYYGYIDKMAEFVKGRYGDRVILIDARDSNEKIGALGVPESAGKELRRPRLLIEKLNLRFIEKTGCHYIKTPPNVLADDFHKWGASRVHFVVDYYRYVKGAIDYITSTEKPDPRTLDMMYLKACRLFSDIRSGRSVAEYDPSKKVMLHIRHKRWDEANAIVDGLVGVGNPLGDRYLAEIYRKGYGRERDDAKALEHARKAVKAGFRDIDGLYMKLLWALNTPEADRELVEYAMESGSVSCKEMLVKAYTLGRGVEKDRAMAKNIKESIGDDGLDD